MLLHAVGPSRPATTTTDQCADGDQFSPNATPLPIEHTFQASVEELPLNLQAAISDWTERVLRSVARQIESKDGDLIRRKQVRYLLSKLFRKSNGTRASHVRVVVHDKWADFIVLISSEGRWSVAQQIDLEWKGHHGVGLSCVKCEYQTRVPIAERETCEAWFVKQGLAVEAHFQKHVTAAARRSAKR